MRKIDQNKTLASVMSHLALSTLVHLGGAESKAEDF
jgi:hypothetical protein